MPPAATSASLRPFAPALRRLAEALTRVRGAVASTDLSGSAARVAEDVTAALFHAEPPGSEVPVVVLLGGTGTGKSTLVNRLLGAEDRGAGAITATSFRRTFTAGCVAVTPEAGLVPRDWLGVPHRIIAVDNLPARGTPDQLAIIERPGELRAVLVDTPDLDGDVPEHHRQADRAFRWAQHIILVATPEKYQLPEVPRYAALAERYRIPRNFVLNKADDLEAPDDWQRQLGGETVHIVPRDDAALSVAEDRSLAALRQSLRQPAAPTTEDRAAGLAARCSDVAGRAADGVLAPLGRARRRADEAKQRLAALVRPEAGVDVHPMTRHLQRRLRQQSVLYLMGPQRMLDRVKAVPSLVARLPRSTWDLVTKGKLATATSADEPQPEAVGPDFRGELVDGLRVLQTRCNDVLTDLEFPADAGEWRLPEQEAAAVAEHELAELRRWLEARWDSKPRDTRALEWLAKHLPGGRHVTKLSEAAPYMLVAVSAATNVVMGPVDQVVIGGYLLTTWLGEKLSNEVATRTRETNQRIGRGFAEVCDRQVKRAAEWAGGFAPDKATLAELEKAVNAVARLGEEATA